MDNYFKGITKSRSSLQLKLAGIPIIQSISLRHDAICDNDDEVAGIVEPSSRDVKLLLLKDH